MLWYCKIHVDSSKMIFDGYIHYNQHTQLRKPSHVGFPISQSLPCDLHLLGILYTLPRIQLLVLFRPVPAKDIFHINTIFSSFVLSDGGIWHRSLTSIPFLFTRTESGPKDRIFFGLFM